MESRSKLPRSESSEHDEPQEDHGAPALLARAIGRTRYVVLLAVAAVLLVSVALFVFGAFLAVQRLWEAGHAAVGGAGVEPFAPGFAHSGFLVADAYDPYYSALDPWTGAFGYDPLYYDTYYAQWPVELPTPSMVSKALPEGVVSPGGQLSGFVLFQDVPDDMERVTFRARVVNAATGERMGTVDIPFQATDA